MIEWFHLFSANTGQPTETWHLNRTENDRMRGEEVNYVRTIPRQKHCR